MLRGKASLKIAVDTEVDAALVYSFSVLGSVGPTLINSVRVYAWNERIFLAYYMPAYDSFQCLPASPSHCFLLHDD